MKFGTTRRDALLDMTEEDILFHMWKHSLWASLRQVVGFQMAQPSIPKAIATFNWMEMGYPIKAIHT